MWKRGKRSRSKSWTRRPCWASRVAVVLPAGPPPMTTTSVVFFPSVEIMVVSLWRVGRGPWGGPGKSGGWRGQAEVVEDLRTARHAVQAIEVQSGNTVVQEPAADVGADLDTQAAHGF